MPDDDNERIVWLRSDVMPDGSYRAVVEFDLDHSAALTHERAMRYSTAILDAVQAAEYDAAVLRQLTGRLALDATAAGQLITRDLRAARRPLRSTGTALALRPGVTAEGHAFLVVSIGGSEVGQWSLADARGHALYALEASLAADYDATYHRTLVAKIGVTDRVARATVQDIGNYRDEVSA